jgi:3-oxoadipate enol-lactonase
MTYANLPGVNLWYESHGAGRSIVFIHGAGGNRLSWWRQASAFQHRARVILYDQRGFGASRQTGDYDPGDAPALTGDLANLLDHLDLKTGLIIVGHSLGTLPALDFAQANPERVAALVLSSAYGALSTADLAPRIAARAALFSGAPPAPRLLVQRSPDEVLPYGIAEQDFGPLGTRTRDERPELAFLYGALAGSGPGPSIAALAPVFSSCRKISAEQARALPFPVLLIGGEEDPVFPPAELALAAAAFARGRFACLAGAGHSSYFERPEAFNTELGALLDCLA